MGTRGTHQCLLVDDAWNATSMDVYVSSSSPSSLATQELVRADATCFPANSSFIVGVVLCQELDSSYFHSLDNSTATIELFNISCDGHEMMVEDYCTGDIVVSGGRQFGIESPVHVDCDFQLGICDWNITDNNTLWDKVTIMEVNKTFKGFTNWTDDVIAIVWLDSKTRRWSTFRNMSGTVAVLSKAAFLNLLPTADHGIPPQTTHLNVTYLSLVKAGNYSIVKVFIKCCNIKQRRRTTSQTHNLADSEYLNFLTIRENTPRIAKDREELIVTYDPSVESFESSAVDSSPEDRPNVNSSRQQPPMYPTQGTRCIQSPESDYVVRRESSRSTIVPDIHEPSFDQYNMTRGRNFLQSLRRRLASCLGLDPPLDPPHALRKASNNETGLDDSSLEELLNNFNSLVLSFHWSDMTPIDTFQSDDELSVSDVPSSTVVSEMFVRRWSKQRLCRMMSEDDCRSTLWGSVVSDRDTVFSCASSLSREGSFFSIDCLSRLDLAESLPLSE
uniref:Uncharacterized protein n=1 Tax=Timema monikensis TaxID=170555 RepID=A0A7R9HMK3_9NEOP|nr:unnamed protein product [Timema monikensis]